MENHAIAEKLRCRRLPRESGHRSASRSRRSANFRGLRSEAPPHFLMHPLSKMLTRRNQLTSLSSDSFSDSTFWTSALLVSKDPYRLVVVLIVECLDAEISNHFSLTFGFLSRSRRINHWRVSSVLFHTFFSPFSVHYNSFVFSFFTVLQISENKISATKYLKAPCK